MFSLYQEEIHRPYSSVNPSCTPGAQGPAEIRTGTRGPRAAVSFQTLAWGPPRQCSAPHPSPPPSPLRPRYCRGAANLLLPRTVTASGCPRGCSPPPWLHQILPVSQICWCQGWCHMMLVTPQAPSCHLRVGRALVLPCHLQVSQDRCVPDPWSMAVHPLHAEGRSGPCGRHAGGLPYLEVLGGPHLGAASATQYHVEYHPSMSLEPQFPCLIFELSQWPLEVTLQVEGTMPQTCRALRGWGQASCCHWDGVTGTLPSPAPSLCRRLPAGGTQGPTRHRIAPSTSPLTIGPCRCVWRLTGAQHSSLVTGQVMGPCSTLTDHPPGQAQLLSILEPHLSCPPPHLSAQEPAPRPFPSVSLQTCSEALQSLGQGSGL